MIKKYLPDAVIILFVFSLAILLAGKPNVNFNPHSVVLTPIDKKADPEKIKETKAEKKHVDAYAALEKRNIFTEAGTYAGTGQSLSVLPANPYKLVAVLQGNDKKAIFREYTGAVISVPVGKKMIDEYVVESLEGMTVKLKKGKETKVLTVFNPERAPAAIFPDDKKKMSANPYKLIGILNGKERKAVIKDYTNSVFLLTIGEKLGDGSVLTAIGDVSVKLKKEKENIELKIFGNHAP